MPGLKDQFQHFYMPDDDAIATAMKTGLVVPDTNVLLNLYRFQSEAREQLFGALDKVSDRLWTPHQVGLEFHRNRLGVIAEQEAYFKKVVEEFGVTADALTGKAKAFGNRIALDKLRVEGIERLVAGLQMRFFDEAEKAEKANEVRLTDRDSDGVLARAETLFENRVGEPMEPKVLEEAKKEAKRRADAGIPPGYKDKTKPDPTGDYLVWRQLLDEAKTRNLPVVFVTDDRKEDWYRRDHGLTLGARYELQEEMQREAGVPLLMMTTETFLRHAKTYLDATVSDETVDQAKELPGTALKDLSVTLDRVNLNRHAGAYADRSVPEIALPGWVQRELDKDAGSWPTLFAWALQVPPHGVPWDIRDAEAVILNYLGSGEATDEQKNQAGAWFLALHRERAGHQDEPPGED